MLMLGESILSLLIVKPGEMSEYVVTFYSSIVTVFLLCYLHFRSVPHTVEDHVLRRSKNRGMIWKVLTVSYSSALIAMGAAFTLLVLSFTEDEDEYRRQLELVSGDLGDLSPGKDLRRLAGGTSVYSPEDLEQRAANLFSISLSLVFFSLDGMSLMHLGFDHAVERCRDKTKSTNIMGTILLGVRIGLIVLVATLSQWETRAQVLAVLGLAITFGQILLRTLGTKYLNKNLEHATDSENGSERAEEDHQSGEIHYEKDPSERNPELVHSEH